MTSALETQRGLLDRYYDGLLRLSERAEELGRLTPREQSENQELMLQAELH